MPLKNYKASQLSYNMPKQEQSFDQRYRIWSFNKFNSGKSAYEVCAGTAESGEPKETLVVQIPSTAWRRGAINFEEWDKSRPSSAYWRQIFSMICHLANMAVETYTDMLEADERRQGTGGDMCMATSRLNGPPVKMYIESVFATDDVKAGGATIPRTVAYRFHVFLFSPNVTFGVLFWNMIDENRALRKQELDSKARFKTHGFKNILPHQHYKLINSIEHFTKVICGLYTGHQAHWDNLDEAMLVPDDVTYKSWRVTTEFMAHPCNIFTLETAIVNYKRILKDLQLVANQQQILAKRCIGNSKQQCVASYEEVRTEDENTEHHYTVPFFHYSETVLRLDNSQMHPAVLMKKYFPDYQRLRFQTAQSAIGQRLDNLEKFRKSGADIDMDSDDYVASAYANFVSDATVFDPTLLQEYGVDLIQSNKELRDIMTSDVAMMRTHARSDKFWSVEREKGEKEWCEAREAYQKRHLAEFHSRVWDSNSHISEPMQRLVEFQQSDKSPMVPDEKHHIPELSIFANMVVRWMEMFEQLALVSTTHRNLFTLMIGSKDAFRVTFGLHFNCILTGRSATSKSFNLNLLKELTVAGTMEQLTYQTAKSDAVDGHKNDSIQAFHELPTWFFTRKGKEVDPSEAMMKEKLTSLRVRCKTIQIDDDTHIRRQRTTESECISVFLGCTNDDPSQVTESLASRFMWMGTEENEREGRSIRDLMPARNNFDQVDNEKFDEMLLRGHQDQMIHCVVEKLIYCGIMKDVDMSVANIVHQQFDKYVVSRQTSRVHPRCSKRLRIMARLLTITNAIECVFRVSTGQHYKKRFEIKMALDLEPYLWCTEEIALFAIGLMEDQYIDPCRYKTLNTLKKMDARSARKNTARFKKCVVEGDEPASFDYNYITFTKGLHKIKNMIYCNIPIKMGRPSEYNIKSTLDRLSKETFLYKPHKLGADGEVCVDETKPLQSFTCVLVDRDKVHVHTALLLDPDLECNTIIEKGIAASQHSATIDSTYLSGQLRPYNHEDPMDFWDPHLLQTYKRTKNKRVNNVANPLYSTNTSRLLLGMKQSSTGSRSVMVHTHNGDLDEAARKRHLRNIGCSDDIGCSKKLKAAFTPIDSAEEFTYPGKYLEEVKSKKRKRFEAMNRAEDDVVMTDA